MDINIVGYSERGVINALLYGIALNKDEKAMKEFISLAGITNNYCNYKLYSEFSLSEFGSPDFTIIADDKDVFFIEAKVSCGKKFDLKEQKNHHDSYLSKKLFVDGHASNLFFQLRLKEYFYRHKINNDDINKLGLPPEIRFSRGRDRKEGENVVVRKFINELKGKRAYYIAIIPECDSFITPRVEKYDDYNITISFITWESIIQGKYTGRYLTDTILFNQNQNVSQILNRPYKK